MSNIISLSWFARCPNVIFFTNQLTDAVRKIGARIFPDKKILAPTMRIARHICFASINIGARILFEKILAPITYNRE